MSREVMQQALDALCSPNFEVHVAAIAALNEELAKPEQEPVRREQQMFMDEQELYAAPPAAPCQPIYDYTNEADTEELVRVSNLPEPLHLAFLLEKTMQWPLHGKAADCLRRMYAAQRQPLTDEEIEAAWVNSAGRLRRFARAIEAAHGIKENT